MYIGFDKRHATFWIALCSGAELNLTISKMFSSFLAIVFGYFLLNLKINDAKGSNATSFSSTVQPASTTTISKHVQSTISPTPTTRVPEATQTVLPTTKPKITVPKPPTAKPPETYKRIYGFTVTLENLPWKEEYKNNQLQSTFMPIYFGFFEEMKVVFKNGSFPELQKLNVPSTPDELRSNDTGKLRTKFLAMFDAVPTQGSKEPEIYFRLNNFQRGSKYKYYVVPSSIEVEEKVKGGVIPGNWTVIGEILKSCCGESVYQNRTCSEPSSGSCDGLHLNRTFQCHLMYPVTCGKVRRFTFNMTLGKAWKDGYKDSRSKESKDLITELTKGEGSLLEEVRKMFINSSTGYKELDLNSLQFSQDKGKVHVSFIVLFNANPSKPVDPEALFRFKTDNGKLGNFEINTKSIKVEENVPGYTFTPWTNKVTECDKCCGGQIHQTRTCQSKMGQCSNAQLTRSIRCKHVCQEVKCGDSSVIVPYALGILLCILASSFF